MGQKNSSPKRKVLVVDKNYPLRLLQKVELEEEGYKVLLASKAQEALEILKNEQPDLIVMDSMLSGINRIEGLQ